MLTDKHFVDWEMERFGYGYGTGEIHIMRALKTFMSLCKQETKTRGYPGYDYREIEAALGPSTTWLLINVLAGADMIEYGSSPRFAWLDEKGIILKEYLDSKSAEELADILTAKRDIYCTPDQCQCEIPCNNPLW